MEPWTFNNALIALKEVDGVNIGDVGEFRHTRLWVQVHNLPSEGMIEEIGVREASTGVNLGVLAIVESFVVTDFSMSYSSWKLPMDTSLNLCSKKLGNLCAILEEHDESCSVPDILRFKVLYVVKNDISKNPQFSQSTDLALHDNVVTAFS
ncbi:hypothetical protein L484_006984 [Morus notabilis]|uniref:DUF4283 domain-containing protein n=1 Tax=Morus notabilis TaxID=981085 RepID=W9SV27_9ROSA|nr:hypothetical protein L484_006984 [Morus notabilis]